MVEISYRIMNRVLEAKGLPLSVEITNLPDTKTLMRVRGAFTTAKVEMLALIDATPLAEVVNGFRVGVTSDGRIVSGDSAEATSRVAVSYPDEMMKVSKAIGIIGMELPVWAEAALNHNQLTVQAKAGTGALRARIIPTLLEQKLNNGDWYSDRTKERADGTGEDATIAIIRVVRLIELAKMINSQGLSIMREAFRKDRGANVVPVATHDTFKNFDKYMKQRRDKLRTNAILIDNMPILPHGTTVNLTWGIEVESGGARNVDAPGGWDRKGDSSLRSAYGDNSDVDEDGYRYIDPSDCDYADQHEDEYLEGSSSGNRIENPDWIDPDDCEECGSVYAEDDGEYGDCAEFVSPILRSFHSQGLEQITAELSQNPQNDSAGVHVHVGAKHLTPKQLGNLVLGYQMIEPLIEASYRRSTREYCRERPLDDVARVLKSARTAKQLISNDPYTRRTDVTSVYTGDRYHSLNLQSLYSHGTVEFRAMGPVYNYESLIKWASFVREMVNCAGNGAGPRDFSAVTDWNSLMVLFAKFGVEYAKAEFAEIKENTTAELRQLASAEV